MSEVKEKLVLVPVKLKASTVVKMKALVAKNKKLAAEGKGVSWYIRKLVEHQVDRDR